MYDEIMTGTNLGASKGFSAITFAALKDMGWYTVDDSFNETTNYGYQKGCDFINNACLGSASFP
jgi:Leishmanolysin